MARETKVGLLIGLGLILLIGIIVSDQLSMMEKQDVPSAVTGFANRAQQSIDPFASEPGGQQRGRGYARQEDRTGQTGQTRMTRVQPIPTARELEQDHNRRAAPAPGSQTPSSPQATVAPWRDNTADQPDRESPRELPRAMALDQGPVASSQGGVWPASSVSMIPPDPPAPSASPNPSQPNTPSPAAASASPTQARDEPTPVTPDAQDARPNDIVHTIEKGESLAGLARRYYGDEAYWKSIAEANPDAVGDKGLVRVGVRLVIPNRADLAVLPGELPGQLPGQLPGAGAGNTENSPRQPSLEQVAAAHGVQIVRVGERGGNRSPEIVPEPIAVHASAPKASAVTITVSKGDTLSELAEKYLGSQSRWKKFMEANPDILQSAADLQAGMALRLPAGAKPPASTASAEDGAKHPGTRPGGAVYTVKTGDTLGQIAQQVLGSRKRWHELYKANKDRLDDANDLKVGTELRLPS